MRADLLAEKYPAAPDGSVEIERERMSYNDVKYARWRLMQASLDACNRAEALDRWWREKRKAERAASGVLPVTNGQKVGKSSAAASVPARE